MQILKKLKSVILSYFLVVALIVPSTVAFAAEDVVRGQEIETPASVQEAIAELQQDKSSDHVFSFPETYNLEPSVVNLAAYRDRNFTGRSAPEPLVLRKSCDTISLTASCAGENVVDDLTVHIRDNTYGGLYDTDLIFAADGSVTTIARALPEGEYKIYFTGDAAIVKLEGIVVFSRFE